MCGRFVEQPSSSSDHFAIDADEAEDWLHLWRLIAWVMGIEQSLLPNDYAEAARMRELIVDTQGPPDADSRALAAALLDMSGRVEGLDPRLDALRKAMIRALARMLGISPPIGSALPRHPAGRSRCRSCRGW